MKYYLAIDVGGTFTKYAIVTETGEILEKGKKETEKRNLEAFLVSIEAIYNSCKEKKEIEGLGLSIPGVVDTNTGYMKNGGALTFIENFPMGEMLQQKLGIPVSVENDARCAALAEVFKGALEHCENGVVIVLGTGIGGALIENRKILRGAHQMCGEFSYLVTNIPDGAYSVDDILYGMSGAASLKHNAVELMHLPEEVVTGELIFERAKTGDENAIEAIRRYVRPVAVTIFNLQFTFDPEITAIGGGVSEQPLLIELLREEVQKIYDIHSRELPMPVITACRFFNDSNLIGATYAHIQRMKDLEEMN